MIPLYSEEKRVWETSPDGFYKWIVAAKVKTGGWEAETQRKTRRNNISAEKLAAKGWYKRLKRHKKWSSEETKRNLRSDEAVEKE